MLAVVLDVVYQIIAEHFVYPGEAITVAIVLALVPSRFCADWKFGQPYSYWTKVQYTSLPAP